MGLFSKKPKSNPKISVEGIEISFNRDQDWWEFKYCGTEFWSFEPVLTLPTKAELDAILDAVNSLKSEMRARLEKDLKLDNGESYTINLQDFATKKSFMVSWSDGATWGDMGIDFTIKDGAILHEDWGD